MSKKIDIFAPCIYQKALEMEEEWRDIKGFEDYYQVSSLGRVRGLYRITKFHDGRWRMEPMRVLKPVMNNCKCMMVCLGKNGKRYNRSVRKLVADAFGKEMKMDDSK